MAWNFCWLEHVKKRRKKRHSGQIQKPSQQIPPPEPVKEDPESMQEATPPAMRETEKEHPERIQESPRPKKWGKRQKQIVLMMGMMALLALVFCTLYFGSTSFRNLFSKADSYDESMGHIHEDVRLTSQFRQKRIDSDIRYSDFVGSDSCMLCHIEQFTLWRNSTHGRARLKSSHISMTGPFILRMQPWFPRSPKMEITYSHWSRRGCRIRSSQSMASSAEAIWKGAAPSVFSPSSRTEPSVSYPSITTEPMISGSFSSKTGDGFPSREKSLLIIYSIGRSIAFWAQRTGSQVARTVTEVRFW